MPREIISDFKRFKRKLPKNIDLAAEQNRIDALQHYFGKGGVISVSKRTKSWPLLLYPSKLRLKNQLDKCYELRQNYHEKWSQWRKSLRKAQVYYLANNVKKLKEPLYWKHLLLYSTNSDYRKDSDAVQLPVHLVSDKKWKPMVKMFVNDLDYRKQLTETVSTSIVYAKDRKVAKYAAILQDFRVERSQSKIQELEKKINEINNDIKALNELMHWAET